MVTADVAISAIRDILTLIDCSPLRSISITLDEEFVVHDIKVIEGEKGLFIAMPSRKAADGEYRDIAHPINSHTRERLQKVILEEYAKATDLPEEEDITG